MKRVYLAGPPYANEYRYRADLLCRTYRLEPVNPMVRDFRGREQGNEAEIVEGDLDELSGCDYVLADFTRPDEGTAMECWYAHTHRIPVVAYTGGTRPHPWVAYISPRSWEDLEDAVQWLSGLTLSAPQSSN